MKQQIIETCSGCGSRDVVVELDNGWVTRSWRMIRCRACGQQVLHYIPWWTLLLYAVAAGAAIWGWIVVKS